jgi:ABC-type Fe3+/spermidine/putrescine transport system ATPase subunit
VLPLDLDIQYGDFFAILGPSGCGKTTLLRIIAGLVVPSTGSIEIDSVDVTTWSPERRPTNMVFQGYGLFPHMTVRQNIGYGLRVARIPARQIDLLVSEVMALVRLQGFEQRMPNELSGGQAQRVALARALVLKPKVLLLDEPLGALDLQLRKVMQEELRRIHREIGGTFLFVTHDQGEALALANRIAVMNQGRIIQEGSAEVIYSQPQTQFVANFVGDANLLAAHRRNGEIALESGVVAADAGPDGAVTLMIRPESIRLSSDPVPSNVNLPAVVADTVFLGALIRYKVRLNNGKHLQVQTEQSGERIANGTRVTISWSTRDQRVLTE